MFRRIAPLAAAVLALALALPAASFARGPHGGPRIERALERLPLDAATRDAAFAVVDAARPEGRALRADVRAAHEALRSAVEAGEPAEAVMARADALGQLQTELRKHQLRTWLEVRAVLPAEQQQALAGAMRHGHGHGPRHGGPAR